VTGGRSDYAAVLASWLAAAQPGKSVLEQGQNALIME
jgi:hypothetical protein